MIGSIIGDIVGSVYEFHNISTKDFPLFTDEKEATDDSVLSIATAQWILDGCPLMAAPYYAKFALRHEHVMGGYGSGFQRWLYSIALQGVFIPYNSCGNGSAMRIAPVGWAFDTEDEVMEKAQDSAECTHNHPGGIAGAQATALCILWGRQGKQKSFIRSEIERRFGYDLSPTVQQLQQCYSWGGMPSEKWSGATCQGSVPQAIVCALQATDFEDAVRNAISIGGDSDTIGCITGGIAEALYGVPAAMRDKALSYLAADLRQVVEAFEAKYGWKCLNTDAETCQNRP